MFPEFDLEIHNDPDAQQPDIGISGWLTSLVRPRPVGLEQTKPDDNRDLGEEMLQELSALFDVALQ